MSPIEPRVIVTDIRRRCAECQTRTRLAVTDDGRPELTEYGGCPNCGARMRPLTPTEKQKVRDIYASLEAENA